MIIPLLFLTIFVVVPLVSEAIKQKDPLLILKQVGLVVAIPVVCAGAFFVFMIFVQTTCELFNLHN